MGLFCLACLGFVCFFSNSVTARKFPLSLDLPHIKRTKEILRAEIVALLHFLTVSYAFTSPVTLKSSVLTSA